MKNCSSKHIKYPIHAKIQKNFMIIISKTNSAKLLGLKKSIDNSI